MICQRCKEIIPDESAFCLYCGKKLSSFSATPKPRTRRPNGSGTIKKMSGKRSRPFIAITSSGNAVGTYSTYPEAALALDMQNIKRKNIEAGKLTLQEVYDSFCVSPRYKKLGDAGKEGLSVAWKRLAPLYKRQANTIKIIEYQEIIDTAMKEPRYKILSAEELKKKKPSEQERYKKLISQPLEPLAYDGKNRIKQLISHLYSEMIRLEIADNNPSDLIVLPVCEASVKRNFTEKEKQLLRENDTNDVARMILIYIETGFRLNELLGLKKDSIDLENKIIIGGSKSEAGRDRVVPIADSLYPYIKYFFDKNKVFLFERKNSRISDNYFRNSMFYPLLDKLGIDRQQDGKNVLTPHRTRHTFTADAVKAGMAPEALKEIAGHAKYSTTVEKYADDLDIEYLKQEMNKKK